MNKIKPMDRRTTNNVSILPIIGGYSIGFLLLLMLLSAFVVIPQINKLFDEQHSQNIDIELKEEVALFQNFVENQKTIIDDLARFPSVTNAVMLSEGSNRSVNNLLENIIIGGKKSKIILQNIEGDILVKTTNILQANYGKNEKWLDKIFSSEIRYHFQLLNQNDQSITFKMSVPVMYNGYPEGLLSAEITADFKDIFINLRFNSNVAIRLTQNKLTVGTNTSQIEFAKESKETISNMGIVLTYITDSGPILKSKRTTEKLIYSVLFGGLALCFIVMVILSYSGLIQRVQLNKTNKSIWKTYAIPIFVGVIGSTASIIAFIMVVNGQQASIENNLIYDSKKQAQTIREKLNTHIDVLDAMKSFYNASDYINREEFTMFASPFIHKYKSIKGLEWLLYVSDKERNLYEQNAKADGVINYAIRELNKEGKITLATERDYYFPVHYVEPMLGNENTLGFDLASNPTILEALIRAQYNNKTVVTSRITFHHSRQIGIFILKPIFDTTLKVDSIDKRNLKGVIVLKLEVNNFMNEILQKESHDLSFFIQDISNPNAPEILYGSPPNSHSFVRHEVIEVLGHTWKISSFSKNLDDEVHWLAWITLTVGFIISGLIVFGLIQMIRRREHVEQLVLLRTAELSDSEEQHRAVVENAVDGLLTIDDKGLIERFNHSAENIFGYRAEEVLGKNIKILMPQPYHGEHDGYLKNYKDTRVKKIIGIGRTVEGQRKDGTTFPIELSVSEMNIGHVKKFSGIVRDITERVAFEHEREQFINQLTDSNEELERFAFVCSHDLQEPLRMIRSFSEKLQEHIGTSLEQDEKGKKYFSFVIDGAIRAQALIADILEYSSVSNDTTQLEEVNLNNLVNVIINNTLNTMGWEAEQISNKASPITYDHLPSIEGNKTQLLQLFQNIINNGMKYQKPNVEPRVHISVEEGSEHCTFTIKDNGIGMEERHFKKVFEVFQRLHKRSKYAGTGIGLSICKKVVERHGGNIWVESEKGTGSSFHFTLQKSKLFKEKT